LKRTSTARPAVIDRAHPAMRAAAIAYRRGFGAYPALVRSGGTIPVVNDFQALFGIPTVLLGFALPDDRIHAPNERFLLQNLARGIDTCIWFLAEVGRRDRPITTTPREASTRRRHAGRERLTALRRPA
jgi:acetylornithine deacetylase/succinyl-diaminopimelate desuccinylase-like protein